MRIVYWVGLLLVGLTPVLMFLLPAAWLFGIWGLGTALLLLSNWWERGGEVRVREGRHRVCRCDCHRNDLNVMHCMPCCALTYRKYIHANGKIDWDYYNRLRRELPSPGLRGWVRRWMRFLFRWTGYGRIPRFKKFTFPIVKRMPYPMLANEIIAVQPMTAGTPDVFLQPDGAEINRQTAQALLEHTFGKKEG